MRAVLAPFVIAAHPMETAPLLAAKPNLEVFHFGVGAIKAAQRSHECAEKCLGRDVIYLGTAGIFGLFKSPDLYQVAEVVWSDLGLRMNQSYVIEGDLPAIKLDRPLCEPRPDVLKHCTAACSATISKIPSPLPTDFAYSDALENVELYSIAGPVQAAAQTFTAVLATTNAVGPTAHLQWQQNAVRAAEMTAEFLTKHWLKEI